MAGPSGNHGLRSVTRVSPTEQVREQLLGAIERGQFPPGSLLPSERALCETFGVSRVSVREAMAGLEAMGLITVRHGRGAFVQSGVASRYVGPFASALEPYRDELIELLKVRGALDELTAEEAALQGDPEGLTRVAERCKLFRQAAEEDGHDLARLAELDVAFHMSIAECSGGHLLPKLLGELNALLAESRPVTLGLQGQLAVSVKQHQAISDAISSGDSRKARREAGRHVAGILLRLEKPTPGGGGSSRASSYPGEP
jgi:GntR family transcriptional repressor for pyruvate dehydrogenase complex